MLENKSLLSMLSIGICTKNRVEELRETLLILQGSELKECEVILIDDGSDDEFLKSDEFSLNIIIHTHSESDGLIESRNELAHLCETPYMLILDDDSAPEQFGFESVIKYLETNLDCGVVALSLINKDKKDVYSEAYKSRSYIGCGHILRVADFIDYGGYTGELFYSMEEEEYSLKLAKRDKYVYHVPKPVVFHRRSMINRVVGYNYRWYRNCGYVYTEQLKFLGRIIQFLSVVKLTLTHNPKYLFLGIKDYFIGAKNAPKGTKKLTGEQYRDWKKRKTPSLA